MRTFIAMPNVVCIPSIGDIRSKKIVLSYWTYLAWCKHAFVDPENSLEEFFREFLHMKARTN